MQSKTVGPPMFDLFHSSCTEPSTLKLKRSSCARKHAEPRAIVLQVRLGDQRLDVHRQRHRLLQRQLARLGAARRR